MADPQSYSILFRYQRTTVEETYVSIPVTDKVFQDGMLDMGLVMAAGAKIAVAQNNWRLETGPDVAPHPIQQPLPEDWRH